MPPSLELASEVALDGKAPSSPSEIPPTEAYDGGVARKSALEQRYIELLEKRVAALEALVVSPGTNFEVSLSTTRQSTVC